MKHIFARDFLPYLKDILSVLRQLELSEGSDFVVSLLNYVLTTAKIPQAERFVDIIKEGLPTPTGEKIMTVAEQLIERGEQTFLMKLLHRRFPALNPDYEMRVKNAHAEELSLWGERIFDAKSIEEVFEA